MVHRFGENLPLAGFLREFPQRRAALRFSPYDVAEGDLPVVQRVHDNLYASTDTQAPLRPFDVVVRGALADSQQRAYRPVVLTLRRQLQTLSLTLAELRSARSAQLLTRDATKHGVEHEAGHREQG